MMVDGQVSSDKWGTGLFFFFSFWNFQFDKLVFGHGWLAGVGLAWSCRFSGR